MKSLNTKAIGDIGEEIAVNYLKKQGYKILERNAVYAGVEIDVIMKDGSTIVFCEVKTRVNTLYGRPVEAVTKQKQQRYVQGAKGYIVSHKVKNTDLRFDVIEVLEEEINHIKSAFEC
ncbi:MAG: YraN family protein [Clostridia bacterium]|nr:YraN family protein [Clostridia bacterium]